MSEPRTEAGRWLLNAFFSEGMLPDDPGKWIVEIERQAAHLGAPTMSGPRHVIDSEGVVWRVVRDGGMAMRADCTGATSIAIATLRSLRGPLIDLEAERASRPAPQPLDVERLIKALQSHPDHLTWTTIIRLHSDWLQAAYARLGSQEGSE